MFGIGIQEFGLILVIALLVFGPKRLPELARMLGRGMGEFRRASNDLRESLSLDELQNDLRRDLHSAQSLLKPDLKNPSRNADSDRPAQAGDDIPLPKAEASETPTEDHSGQLPLGYDEEHRPASDSSEASGSANASDSPASPTSSDARDPSLASEVSEASGSSDPSEKARQPGSESAAAARADRTESSRG